jgi:hypothetical protein
MNQQKGQIGCRPLHVEFAGGPRQHDHSLRKTPDAHQLNLLTEDLKRRRPRPEKDAIKIADLMRFGKMSNPRWKASVSANEIEITP